MIASWLPVRPEREVVTAWAAWLGLMVAAVALGLAAGVPAASVEAMPYVDRDGLLWPLRSWDYGWYELIAEDGYPEGLPEGDARRPYAFFPVWPAVLAAGGVVGAAGLVAALVAWLGSLAAFLGVARGMPVLGGARRAAWALACLPGSFALALSYPDGCTLAASVWACLLAQSGRWRWAAALGLLVGAARPDGVLVALPLALLAWRQRRPTALAAAAAPVVGLAAVMAGFWWRSGTPRAFTSAQELWGRDGPTGLLDLPGDALTGAAGYKGPLDIAIAVLAVALCVAVWRRGPTWRPWALYAVAIVGVSLLSGSVDSIGRHAAAAFPLAWVAADSRLLARRPVALAGLAVNVVLAATVMRLLP